MRKLAPLFVSATLALIAGSAAAATSMSNTDKATGSPTVDSNTNNTQGMSYSDKSNTSPGTNAKMGSKAEAGVNEMPKQTAGMAVDEDRKAMKARAKAEKMHARDSKVAKANNPKMTTRAPIDSTVTLTW